MLPNFKPLRDAVFMTNDLLHENWDISGTDFFMYKLYCTEQ